MVISEVAIVAAYVFAILRCWRRTTSGPKAAETWQSTALPLTSSFLRPSRTADHTTGCLAIEWDNKQPGDGSS